MQSNLNYNQLKIAVLTIGCFIKPHGNLRTKFYSRYTKDKEKRIKSILLQKNHQIVKENNKRRKKKYKTVRKQIK